MIFIPSDNRIFYENVIFLKNEKFQNFHKKSAITKGKVGIFTKIQKIFAKKCCQNPNFNPENEIKKIITSRPRVLNKIKGMLQNLDPDTDWNLQNIIFLMENTNFYMIFG